MIFSAVRDVVRDVVHAGMHAVASKTARRAVLYGLLLSVTALGLYAVAAVGYVAFYHEYVPHRVRAAPVHLQYGPALAQVQVTSLAGVVGLDRVATHGYHAPYGLADLRPLQLKADQAYDIAVVLAMPASPANRAVGNFMVELQLAAAAAGTSGKRGDATDRDIASVARLPPAPADARSYLSSHGRRVVYAAARPALLAYADPLVALARRLALLPLHVLAPPSLGLGADRVIVPMAESVAFAAADAPAAVFVEVRTPGVGGDPAYELQTYGVQVVFSARLTGLRWLMYHHRVLSFFVLTGAAWAVEVGCMAGVFAVAGFVWTSDASDASQAHAVVKTEDEGHVLGPVKDELDKPVKDEPELVKDEPIYDIRATTATTATGRERSEVRQRLGKGVTEKPSRVPLPSGQDKRADGTLDTIHS